MNKEEKKELQYTAKPTLIAMYIDAVAELTALRDRYSTECPVCGGSGMAEEHNCPRCNGTGRVMMLDAEEVKARMDEFVPEELFMVERFWLKRILEGRR